MICVCLCRSGPYPLVIGLGGSPVYLFICYVLLSWAGAQMCIMQSRPNRPAISIIRHHAHPQSSAFIARVLLVAYGECC